MNPPLGNQTATRQRATLTVDARTGQQVRDWNDVGEADIEQCLFTPFELSEKLATEYNIEREHVGSAIKCYLPPVEAALEILPTDRLIINNLEYEVLGRPGIWYDFDGSISHVELVARKKEG